MLLIDSAVLRSLSGKYGLNTKCSHLFYSWKEQIHFHRVDISDDLLSGLKT